MKFFSKPGFSGFVVGCGLGFLVAAIAMKRSHFETSKVQQSLKAHSDSLHETNRKLDSIAQALALLAHRDDPVGSNQTSRIRNETASAPDERLDIDAAIPASEFNPLRDLTKAELEQLSHRIQDDRVRRYEESLDDVGREELEKRVALHIEQFSTGTLPGWEGQKLAILDDGKYRESMLARIRRTVLIEKYLDHEFESDMQLSGEERFFLEEN